MPCISRSASRNFVSGSVAKKEHDEFASNIDLIDVLPPGLYEAVITPKEAASSIDDDLVGGDYLVRFEAKNPRRHPLPWWQQS